MKYIDFNEFKRVCRLQKAVRGFFNAADWTAPYGVTLHFRRCIYRKGQAGPEFLTPGHAKQNVRHFLNVLAKRTIGGRGGRRRSDKRQHNKYSKALERVAVVERSIDGVLHYHLQIECPRWELEPAFADLMKEIWSNTHWGAEIHIDRYADPGWIGYITKFRTKDVFADAIDWENTFLPEPSINSSKHPSRLTKKLVPHKSRRAISSYGI